MNSIEKPKYRHLLKARIHECGFKTIKDFSKTINADPNRVSRIITAWEFPSAQLQIRIAEKLDLTLSQLGKML
jgi:hypothetical protein